MAKSWSRYTIRKAHIEGKALHNAIVARDLALTELQSLSEDLYSKAIVTDSTPYPVQLKPPTDTPPNKEYQIALAKRLGETKSKDKRTA